MTWRRDGDLAVVTAAAGITGCGLLPATMAALLAVEVQKTISMTTAWLGCLLAIPGLVAGLTAVAGGRYCETVGWKRAGQTTVMLSVLSFVVLGTAQNVTMLALALALSGLGVSVGVPSAIMVVVSQVSPERQGPAFGLNATSMPLATLIAALALPLAAGNVGWRLPFFVGCCWPVATLIAVRGRAAGHRSRVAAIDRVAPTRALRFAVFGGAFGAFATTAVSAFFVIDAVASGMSSSVAALCVMLGSVGGIIARLVIAWRLDDVSRDGFSIAGYLLMVLALGLLAVATKEVFLMAIAAVVVFTAGLGWQSAFYWGVAQTDVAAPASATGFAQLGIATGWALGPLLFGTFATITDTTAVWLVFACVTLLGGSILLRAGAIHQRSITR